MTCADVKMAARQETQLMGVSEKTVIGFITLCQKKSPNEKTTCNSYTSHFTLHHLIHISGLAIHQNELAVHFGPCPVDH